MRIGQGINRKQKSWLRSRLPKNGGKSWKRPLLDLNASICFSCRRSRYMDFTDALEPWNDTNIFGISWKNDVAADS